MDSSEQTDQRSETPWDPFEYFFGVIFTLVVVTALILIGFEIKHYYYDSNFLPVDTISVHGSLDHTSVEDISIKLASNGVLDNFIRLDVDEVQRLIQDIPWVQSVAVRKQWPSLLSLYVVEKIPQARWGDTQLYSQKAGVFSAPSEHNYQDLVRLDGPEEKADDVYLGYRKYQSSLAKDGFIIEAVNLSDRRSWEVYLKNGPKLILGRESEDLVNRLDRFVKVYRSIQNREQIAYIDLRYDNGLAIGWKKETKGAN